MKMMNVSGLIPCEELTDRKMLYQLRAGTLRYIRVCEFKPLVYGHVN